MIFKKKYHYYITYTYKDEKGTGTGCMHLVRMKPIKTYEDIQEVDEFIKKEQNSTNVIIMDYKRLSR